MAKQTSANRIELYNSSAQSVDLSGFGLSNNAARPRKWRFPAGTAIQPGGYLIVRAMAQAGLSYSQISRP